MRDLLPVLLVIACLAVPAEVACAESLGGQTTSGNPPPVTDGDRAKRDEAAAGNTGINEPAPPPVAGADREKREGSATAKNTGIDETPRRPATNADHNQRGEQAVAASSESQAGNAATAERSDAMSAMCLMLESAATANGLPLEFFARVIWEESRFQLNAVGPTTNTGHRAQGIAQFMPYTAAQRPP